jgi:adenine phosphoribosyltransferase
MSAAAQLAATALRTLVVDVPDFPKPGIVFKDICPLLADHHAFTATIEALAQAGCDDSGSPAVDKVLGIESRGFILGAPVALALGVGFVPVRKIGKLPRATHQVSYELEYDQAVLEIQQDAVQRGERVLVVDDVLATGGTVAATRRLVAMCGARVHAVAVLIELAELGGREAGGPVSAFITV